ncbi:MAG: response regulator transcription factor [Bacteroidota bacterium]
MQKRKNKISLVEDDSMMSDYLQSTINSSSDFFCEAVYETAEEAIEELPKSDTDVVIVDIRLPGKSGIDCVQQVKSLRPDIQFIMYTMFDEGDKIFNSLKAGASGYLIKSNKSHSKKDTILKAIGELLEGGAPMSPSIARKITEFFFNANNPIKELELLSPREKEVLELLSKGYLYKEIGDLLKITTGTVKQHIHKIYQKLHVQNRTEAINVYLGRDV